MAAPPTSAPEPSDPSTAAVPQTPNGRSAHHERRDETSRRSPSPVAATSSHTSTPIVAPLPKRRRLELNGLRFDSPGAAFRSDVDFSEGRPARRAASSSSNSRVSSPMTSLPTSRPSSRNSLNDSITVAASASAKRPERLKLREASPGREPLTPRQGSSSSPTKSRSNLARSSPASRDSPLRTASHSSALIGTMNGVQSSAQATAVTEGRGGELLEEMQRRLDDVHTEHDRMVRELFHLTKFVTYIGYDPEIARQDRSEVFEHFRISNGLNLETQVAAGTSSRTTRRNVSRRLDDLALRRTDTDSREDSPQTAGTTSANAKGKQRMAAEPQSTPTPSRTSKLPNGRKSSLLHNGIASEDGGTSSDAGSPGHVSVKGKKAAVSRQQMSKASREKALDGKGKGKAPSKKKPPGVVSDSSEGEDDVDESLLREILAQRQPRPLPSTPPILEATHPSQVPAASLFAGDLQSYLSSFRYLGTEPQQEDLDLDEAERVEEATAASYARIDEARRSGRMIGEPASAAALRPPRELTRNKAKGQHGMLLDGIASQAAVIRHDARTRRANARKVSKMIQNYWSSRLGDGEKERKALERHLRSLARWTVREVNKQWKLAVNIVRANKAKQEKLERERAGREQLSMILEQSTKYLGERQQDLRRGVFDGSDDDGDSRSDSIDSRAGDGSDGSDSGTDGEADEESLESDVYSIEDDGSESDADEASEAPSQPSAQQIRQDSHHVDSLRCIVSSDGADADPPTETSPQLALPSTPNGASDDAHGPNLLLEPVSSPKATKSNSTSQLIVDITPDAQGSDVEDDAASSSSSSAKSECGADERGTGDARSIDGASDDPEDRVFDEEMVDENASDESEDEDLLAEAEVPIEEVMKRYGYGAHAGGKQEDEAEEDSEQDYGPNERPSESREGEVAKQSPTSEQAEKPHDDGALADDATDVRSSVARTRSRRSSTRASSVMSSERGSRLGSKPARSLHQPFLLRGVLRPYQQAGFEWLASLYANNANGILADEMGLGKTIQTISVLAHLACDKGVWGPHLVIAPTSVMLNWEVEFKKFLPGFKVLSYYGSQKERKEKRVGWNTEHNFNVCITSYQIVLADQHIFRRKAWVYMILDEAHHIKNFRSQRWQTLLGFNSQRRLLLTGTPLQNNLMDLWSLMYFLMPNGLADVPGAGAFANMKDFQDWFSNPLDKAVESGSSMDEETRKMVAKLHIILRPFLLRRLKTEVEKELPRKYEHVIRCRLSKRQRFLYNDFMSRAKTRESLASGNYLSIINCLMQLRKVCNHPDLFEVRPIHTAFAMERSVVADFEIKDLLVRRRLLCENDGRDRLDLLHGPASFNVAGREHLTPIATRMTRRLDASSKLPGVSSSVRPKPAIDVWTIEGARRTLEQRRQATDVENWKHQASINRMRTQQHPTYGSTLLSKLRLLGSAGSPSSVLMPYEVAERDRRTFWSRCGPVSRMVLSNEARAETMADAVDRFAFVPPRAMARDLPQRALADAGLPRGASLPAGMLSPSFDAILHRAATKLQIAFPDAFLLQYDCGKLQQLDMLMRRLKEGGHRILIFTQMTRVLDILEAFLSLHGYRYLRLDGATPIDRRQSLTEKFNRDTRIDAFILSTRSGGLGINLTGADTVLFYDLDWNSAIEAQCMDRAHRIGQTRDVHIYRFVSIATIEENMLRKADQKRLLDSVVIQGGEFTTDHLKRGDWRDMLDEGGKSLAGVAVGDGGDAREAERPGAKTSSGAPAASVPASAQEEERALLAAEDEEDRTAAQNARQEMAVTLHEDDFDRDLPSATPGHGVNGDAGATPDGAATPGAEVDAEQGGAPAGENEAQEAEEEEEEEGTVDDYMLRFVESEWHFFNPGSGSFKV